ncbi:zinc-binding dehydrogenase [Duganella sp. CY15W]|uniref:NADP-dependent oxidoreductase n=1 Tax=Duganella sp. CY15W TaxID=2692172 RepID=UPI00136E072D|nr:NADP-dependent oxidoreductase [Duganella sp. CY15W]MYM26792.1 zinc-binding dehydrogenase [Duganella sp. CY15W]
MKAAFLTGYGGNEVVTLGEVPDPVVKDGEVLIQVHAAGVNPVELAIRAGHYRQLMPLAFPHVPGFDVSGVVLQAPVDSDFQVGDEVFARLSNQTSGAYAEQVAVAQNLLARKPSNISHIEAASLPTVALTTWQAFFERAHLKARERLLVQAGAGGVGTFAIQLAKHVGAQVTATAGTANQAFLKELGVDRALDYTRERFEDVGPFDVVYDGVSGDLTERSILSLAPGGRYVGLVRMSDARAFMSLGLPEPVARAAAANVAGFEALAASRNAEFHGPLTRPDGAQLGEIAALIQDGIVQPFVSQVFPLSQLAAAYAALATGHTRGKIVVDVIAQDVSKA